MSDIRAEMDTINRVLEAKQRDDDERVRTDAMLRIADALERIADALTAQGRPSR